jgi:lactoylglutathione lyase
MRLAKSRIDIGLATHNLEPMLRFWRDEAGAGFDHILKIRPGMEQHRHDLMGSVLKINHHAEALPATPPSGYFELLIAREGMTEVRSLIDPDGNRVTLTPPGAFGVTQIGMRVCVRDREAQGRFYAEALGLKPISANGSLAFGAGESVILIDSAHDAPLDAPFEGAGWRYLTFQVFKVDAEHAHVLTHGGREAVAPLTLGATARISMIKDPAGNWIELSQRASITGSLEP